MFHNICLYKLIYNKHIHSSKFSIKDAILEQKGNSKVLAPLLFSHGTNHNYGQNSVTNTE